MLNGIILNAHVYGRDPNLEKLSYEELEALVKTAGFGVIAKLEARTREIVAGTYMSAIMAQEILEQIRTIEEEQKIKINCIYFSDELSGSQNAHLEKFFGCMVIDRVNMILRIFELHAQTKEAQIQIEIAELEYLAPRLKRMWTHFSRIEGGIGFSKGPGEKQIEIDRRLLKKRLAFLKKRLKDIEKNLDNQNKKRHHSDLPQISLVGYTNVGKTSLLSLLSKEDLYSANKVFATLSPVTRRVYLKEGQFVLISDTVGFISHLPHFLVASFKSTLKQVVYSQGLILLEDASSPYIREHLQVVKGILEDLGAQEIPLFLVFNKIDLVSDTELIILKNEYPKALFISTQQKMGIQELKDKISQNFHLI